jgi:hypothetical protein
VISPGTRTPDQQGTEELDWTAQVPTWRQFTPYDYAEDNPVTRSDPTGQLPELTNADGVPQPQRTAKLDAEAEANGYDNQLPGSRWFRWRLRFWRYWQQRPIRYGFTTCHYPED